MSPTPSGPEAALCIHRCPALPCLRLQCCSGTCTKVQPRSINPFVRLASVSRPPASPNQSSFMSMSRQRLRPVLRTKNAPSLRSFTTVKMPICLVSRVSRHWSASSLVHRSPRPCTAAAVKKASLSHETLVGTLPSVFISAAVDYIISLVFFYLSALRDNAFLFDIGQISRDSPLGNTHLGRLFERRPHLTAFKAAYCYHAFELLISGGKQLLIREFCYSSLRVSAMTASFNRHAACPLLCLRRPSRHLSCAMLHAVSCVAFAFNALGAVSNAHLILVDSSLFFGNNMVTGPSDIYFS